MGEAELDGAHFIEPGLLPGIELDVEPAEVVLKLGEAAGPDDGRGDGRIEQRPGERDS